MILEIVSWNKLCLDSCFLKRRSELPTDVHFKNVMYLTSIFSLKYTDCILTFQDAVVFLFELLTIHFGFIEKLFCAKRCRLELQVLVFLLTVFWESTSYTRFWEI